MPGLNRYPNGSEARAFRGLKTGWRAAALICVFAGLRAPCLRAQGTKPVVVRVVALDEYGKPVAGLSSAEIAARVQWSSRGKDDGSGEGLHRRGGHAVAVLGLAPYAATAGAGSSAHQDRLLYLFPPMQAGEAAKRAKSIEHVSMVLSNGIITVVAPDLQQVSAAAGSPEIEAAIERIAAKKAGADAMAQWSSVASQAIRATAKATGRCVVVLNSTKQYALKDSSNGVGALTQAVNSVGTASQRLGCEVYVVDDEAAMPSEIPPTMGDFRRGETVDSSGQMQQIVGTGVTPVSASGETVSYSMKDALKEVQRDAAGVYWVTLDVPMSCATAASCPLQLTTAHKDTQLHYSGVVPHGG